MLALAAAAPALAQQSKVMRLVVGVPAGGGNDVVARALAPPLSRAFGQSVIVENRPGASGVIAAENVMRAPADGNTVFLAGFSFMANAVMRPKLPYDTFKDFSSVAGIGANPLLFSAHPSLPAKNMKELIALARTRPGQITYATPGSGFPQHLAGEMLKTMAKIDLLHVPYQGGAPATVAVLGGHAQILASTVPLAAPHVASGKLRGLAVTSSTRSEQLKDVPTVAESGVPGYELTSVFGAFVRSATPKPAIDRLSAEILRALEVPEVKSSLLRDGYALAPLGAAEFDAVVRAKTQQIRKIVAEAKIKVD
jgi:tripartite-type tricarboxylate transporter receptor subunit TctC